MKTLLATLIMIISTNVLALNINNFVDLNGISYKTTCDQIYDRLGEPLKDDMTQNNVILVYGGLEFKCSNALGGRVEAFLVTEQLISNNPHNLLGIRAGVFQKSKYGLKRLLGQPQVVEANKVIYDLNVQGLIVATVEFEFKNARVSSFATLLNHKNLNELEKRANQASQAQRRALYMSQLVQNISGYSYTDWEISSNGYRSNHKASFQAEKMGDCKLKIKKYRNGKTFIAQIDFRKVKASEITLRNSSGILDVKFNGIYFQIDYRTDREAYIGNRNSGSNNRIQTIYNKSKEIKSVCR